MIINRINYMNKLLAFKDTQFIKVLNGMRRSGKSTLLKLYHEELKKQNIDDKNIVYMNFESMEYDEIQDYKQLYQFIKEQILTKEQKVYILLDEIQNVTKWEKTINSLLVDYNVDITITGSNAFLLSAELSTLLSGRYVEIKVLPFSLKEYKLLYQLDDEAAYKNYLRYGGLPILKDVSDNEETMYIVLQDIYQSVMMKDVMQKNVVKDAVLLDNIAHFVFDNIGNITSTKRISDILNGQGRKTGSETVDNYLRMLEQAFIIYKVPRFDIKGMQFLKTLEKYYVVDCGLRNAILGYRDRDYGRVLENIVYLELLRRGYEVSIGKLYNLEIDFIAKNRQEFLYIQVAQTLESDEVFEREMKPLLMIKNNYRKMIICNDKFVLGNEKGVEIINCIEFLLQ